MKKITLNRSYSGKNSPLKRFATQNTNKNNQRQQNIKNTYANKIKRSHQQKKVINKPNPDILLDPDGYYMLKKNPLNLDRSILNVTICNKKTQFSQIMDYNNLSHMDINCSDIQNLKYFESQRQKNNIKSSYMLQSLLFDDQEEDLIKGIQNYQTPKIIQKKCLCGCLDLITRNSISRPKYKNTTLKKKWNRYYSEVIFDYFFKEKYEYTYEELKQKMRRFFLNNNLIFRLEQLEQSLAQLFNMTQDELKLTMNSKKTICYRKFGIYLEDFTKSNQTFAIIHKLSQKYHEKYISFNQLKMEILHNTSRTFYQKFKRSVESLKLSLSGLINIQQQFCYWDVYKIKDSSQCNEFICSLKQYDEILKQIQQNNMKYDEHQYSFS